MNNKAILVINAGSSSIKFSLFACADAAVNPDLTLVYRGSMTGIGTEPQFHAADAKGNTLIKQAVGQGNHEHCLSVLLQWLREHEGGLHVVAAGHRVVHGGSIFSVPVKINDSIFNELESLIPLAPLHQPHNLAPIRALAKLQGDLPQIACFDTAFHRTQPAVEQAFALPRYLSEQGVKRYGFHGLSYEYIAQQLPKVTNMQPSHVVVAHLGNGASMCALRDGQSMATTMGFTALDGLPMGTRSGALDAGVVLHLLDQGMDAKAISRLLYHESGLLGVSGISNDMRQLLESDSPHAAEAVELFAHRINRELGALSAAIGGLNALVFTAGIGEHAAPLRAKVCEKARWLGIALDPVANAQHALKISTPDSRVSVWVIPTNEELMIAQHTYSILGD